MIRSRRRRTLPAMSPARLLASSLVLCLAAGAARADRDEPVRVSYKPGRWVRFHLPHKTRLSMRLLLQPLARFSHVQPASGPSPDDTVDTLIRRGRFGMQVDAHHRLGLRFEMSVKNTHSEIHNMYGFWTPSPDLELQVGFIKAPGGLERDTSSFDQEFIERSIVTYYNRDHELGVKLAGEAVDDTVRWMAAVTRDQPPLAGGDPEDTPVIPAGVEAEDLTRAASKWASEGRLAFVPDDGFEVSVNAGVRLRLDEPDFGEIAVEPYDSTFLTNRPYRGVMVKAGADLAVARDHWKVSVEGGIRRDGTQLAYPDGTIASETELDGHLLAYGGYLIAGWTPNGRFGAAYDAAPLRKGWGLVMRAMAQHVKPVDARAANFGSVELGWHWEASPHLRVQVDAAVQRFGKGAHTVLDENLDSTRYYAQTWALFRL